MAGIVRAPDKVAADLGASRYPVFVVGADRSGTTLLRLVLNRHPDLAIPAESGFLLLLMERIRPARALSDKQLAFVARTIRGHRRFQDWTLSQTDPDLKEVLAQAPFRSLDHFVDVLYSAETSASARWGDKTPEYVFHLRRLSEHFPAARFVAIVRDPRDVVLSLVSLGWRGKSPWGVASYLRRVFDALDAAARRLGDRLLIIRYEDVITDPAATADAVCRHLELAPDANMARFWEDASDFIPSRSQEFHSKLTRPPSPEDLGRWRRASDEKSLRAVAITEALVGDAIARFGYEPRTSPAALRRAARLAHWGLEARRRLRRSAGVLKRRAQ